MFRASLLTASTALILSGAAAAGPLDMRLVPADAGWVAHLDLDALKSSSLGQMVLNDPQFPREEMVREFQQKTGLNPLTDLHGMTLFGRSLGGDDGGDTEEPVLLVVTSDKVDKLVAAISLRPEYAATEADGFTVHSWTDGGDQHFGVVLPGATPATRYAVIAPDKRRAAEAAAAVREPRVRVDLAKSPLGQPPASGSWLFVSASEIAQSLDLEVLSVVMQRASGFRADIGENQGSVYAEVDVGTRNEADATNIHQIVLGGLAMVRFAASQDPQARPLIGLADGVTATVEGPYVRVRMRQEAGKVLETLRALEAGQNALPDAEPAPEPEQKPI